MTAEQFYDQHVVDKTVPNTFGLTEWDVAARERAARVSWVQAQDGTWKRVTS